MTPSPKRGRHAAPTTKPLRTQFRRWPHPHHAKRRPAPGPRRWLATAGLGALAVTGVTTLALTSAAPAFASSARAAAATTATARASHQPGQLVSVTPLRSLPTVAAVRSELTGDDFDAGSVRYGIRSYRVVYRTVDAHRRPATASGLMVLPDRGARQLSVVSYDHGTATRRPSRRPAPDPPPPTRSRRPGSPPPPPTTSASTPGAAGADPAVLRL